MDQYQTATCDIEPKLKDDIQSFLYQKRRAEDGDTALVLKIDKEKKLVLTDELLTDIKLDDLQEHLPSHQPRYILFNYRMTHSDKRISNPIVFIFYTPRDSQPDLQVLYASMKVLLTREVGLPRVYEVRDIDDLTEDWLQGKLS